MFGKGKGLCSQSDSVSKVLIIKYVMFYFFISECEQPSGNMHPGSS
jgi:hypothetical protein